MDSFDSIADERSYQIKESLLNDQTAVVKGPGAIVEEAKVRTRRKAVACNLEDAKEETRN
jgi:hypothetical protein